MTSLVAPKPSDGPTSPGLMSYGSDPSALDDYLNLDLFGARPSNSPASSHGALPVTPSTAPEPTSFPALDQSPGGTLGFVDYTPLDKTFGAFPELGMPSSSDMGLEQYSSLFQDMFPAFSEPAAGPSAPVIDPQLFTAPPPEPQPAPAAPTPAPVESESEEDEDEEIDEVAPLPARRRPKKNAAAAGGIAKRPSRSSTPASVVPSYLQFDDPKPVIPPALGKGGVASYLNGERIGSQEPDEWRPTPEEYKKLSSKEKRQLRNKISARNFRVRRKEYISTLESHIADRDQLISAIRSELSLTHNENNELRREIDALKRAIQEGRLSAEATGLPPPRPLTPDGQVRRPELTRPNTKKDRGGDPSARSFWGGAVGHGGVTSVHTTLVPDVFPNLAGKPRSSPQSLSPPSSASPSTPPNEGVNMNPLMNLSPLFASSKLPSSHVGLDVMDQAFNQRTLDGFRAQLWGRMAKEAGARSAMLERQGSELMSLDSDQPPVSPQSSASSPFQASPQQSSGSSASSSSSPQQSLSSSSSPAPGTISSSPSLSMLNNPSPATIRSLFETAASSLFSNTTAPASTPAPALLQASSFGAGFLGANPANTAFNQNTASNQARAMLQAQWLALQQARQQSAASPASPSLSNASTSAAPAAQSSPNPAAQSAAQRENYLAQFAQAAAAQHQQLQLSQQQQQLSGLASAVRPAFLAAPSKTDKDKEKKLVGALDKLSLSDKKASTSAEKKSSSPIEKKSSSPIEKRAAAFPEKKLVLPSEKKSVLPSEKKSTVPEKKGTTPQQAAFAATLASQTLFGRMGSAFWDAFSGNLKGDVDTDKVRRVLEGKAVVRVVDVDAVDGLEERMRSMSVGMGVGGDATGVFSNLRGKK